MYSRLAEIKNIISTHRPHILGISEANLKDNNHDKNICSIPDYSLHTCPVSQNGMIRLVVYIHKDITFKIRRDLMSSDLCSVWIEAGLKNKRKILINQFYREWQQLGVQNTFDVTEQLTRWDKHLHTWERALNTGPEVICTGDYN